MENLSTKEINEITKIFDKLIDVIEKNNKEQKEILLSITNDIDAEKLKSIRKKINV